MDMATNDVTVTFFYGDWVENLTALEYKKGKWSIYQYLKEHYKDTDTTEEKTKNDIVVKILS
jgi:hypothetical protein